MSRATRFFSLTLWAHKDHKNINDPTTQITLSSWALAIEPAMERSKKKLKLNAHKTKHPSNDLKTEKERWKQTEKGTKLRTKKKQTQEKHTHAYRWQSFWFRRDDDPASKAIEEKKCRFIGIIIAANKMETSSLTRYLWHLMILFFPRINRIDLQSDHLTANPSAYSLAADWWRWNHGQTNEMSTDMTHNTRRTYPFMNWCAEHCSNATLSSYKPNTIMSLRTLLSPHFVYTIKAYSFYDYYAAFVAQITCIFVFY